MEKRKGEKKLSDKFPQFWKKKKPKNSFETQGAEFSNSFGNGGRGSDQSSMTSGN